MVTFILFEIISELNSVFSYERYQGRDGKDMYASVGYATVYQYYAYPQNVRPRISQMLVLPPFQKFHIGTQFLETIYKFYMKQSVVDITVEDPSEEFQQLRNFVDVKLCMNLPIFTKESVKSGFKKSMIDDTRALLKVSSCHFLFATRTLFIISRLTQNNAEKYMRLFAYITQMFIIWKTMQLTGEK